MKEMIDGTDKPWTELAKRHRKLKLIKLEVNRETTDN